MSAVALRKFVLQENKVLEQFVRHRSTPAVHRQTISSALAVSDLVSYLKLTSLHKAACWHLEMRATEGECSRSMCPSECHRVASPA